MKWFYCTGIFLHYFLLVHGENKKDCLVKDHYKEHHWDGKEIIFFAYVKENDVVEIKITYNFIDVAKFFTILYISPLKNQSRKMETKDGIHNYFDLPAMKVTDDWVEFKISLQTGTIEVVYGPNTNEQISVNQTSIVPKDLNVRSSFIALCRQEKEWKVYDEPKTILFGRYALHKTFILKFHSFKPHLGVTPGIRKFNSCEKLPFNDYYLTIERTKFILKPMEDELHTKIIPINENATTMDVCSESGKFTVSVLFNVKPLQPLVENEKECLNSSLPYMASKDVANEDNCPNCNDTNYLVGFIVTLSLLIVASIIIGVLIKYKFFRLRIQQIKRKYTNNTKEETLTNQQELKVILSKTGTSDNNSSALTANEEVDVTSTLCNGHHNGIPN